MNPVRVTVWSEFLHEQRSETIRAIYPRGMHGCIAEGLNEAPDITTVTATLQEPEHGLAVSVLEETDVLFWWGHKAHEEVADSVVERVCKRVNEGMGFVALHSAHYSKVFKRLLGTTCSLTWRQAAEKERLWVCDPSHPIALGLPPYFELPEEEMYGEPFGIPAPDEQVFISWFQGGEVFRSGCTWKRGAGKIFYFRPGHETHPTYHDAGIKQVLKNAARWARPAGARWVDSAPQIPREKAPERDSLR